MQLCDGCVYTQLKLFLIKKAIKLIQQIKEVVIQWGSLNAQFHHKFY